MKKYKFIVVIFFFSILFNLFIQKFDNKYTHNDIEALCGIVDYSETNQDLHFLTKQWEFYQDLLLTPETIDDYTPTRYIDIGQFGGFELGDKTRSPHGQATYRLRIFDKENRVVTMQLPEIYSAYSLYVNGHLLYKSGEVEKQNYQPKLQSTAISFIAQASNEIIIQVSDYNHYYSGMIYPIAYGSNQQINMYQMAQTLIKGFQSFLPLVMGFICLITYLFAGRQAKDGYFALVCFSYLGYILYGIIHLIMTSQSFLWYRLEDINYYFLIYFIFLLILQHYHIKIAKKYVWLGIAAIIIILLLPAFFIANHNNIIFWISDAVRIYKYLFAFLMIYIIFKNITKKQSSLKYLPAFIIFFVVSFIMDGTFWYEPIILGWGSEIAGFALITYFTIVMVLEKITLYKDYRDSLAKRQHLKDYIVDVAHDLKAPAASINGYVELLSSGVAKRQNKEEYLLEQMANSVDILSKRITLLQVMDFDKEMILHKELVIFSELVKQVKEKYQILLADKELIIELRGEDYELSLDKEKILLCIENIIMNAIEYANHKTSIIVTLSQDETSYQISITNQGVTIDKGVISHIFERNYTTSSHGHSGLGLSICKKIMQAHVGEIKVDSQIGYTSFILIFIKK